MNGYTAMTYDHGQHGWRRIHRLDEQLALINQGAHEKHHLLVVALHIIQLFAP